MKTSLVFAAVLALGAHHSQAADIRVGPQLAYSYDPLACVRTERRCIKLLGGTDSCRDNCVERGKVVAHHFQMETYIQPIFGDEYALGVNPKGEMIIYHKGVPLEKIGENVRSFTSNSNGELQFHRHDNSVHTFDFLVNRIGNTFKLGIDFDGRIFTENGTLHRWYYRYPVDPELPSISPYVGYFEQCAFHKSNIYILDSGVSDKFDALDGVRITDGEKWIQIPRFVGQNMSDNEGHGTLMALLSKSKASGLGQGHQVVSVRITDDDSKRFNEKAFIEGIRAVINHQTDRNKIISFSGVFNNTSDIVQCGIQIAYENGISFVSAAGNNNENQTTFNPYNMMVGAVKNVHNTPTEETGYGAAVRLWAPDVFISDYIRGTSISAALTASLITRMSCNLPKVKGNPRLAYAQLLENAISTINPLSDKVQQSPNAGMKRLYQPMTYNFLDDKDMKDSRYFPDLQNYNFCERAGVPSKSINELVGKANSSRFGDLVTQTMGRRKFP